MSTEKKTAVVYSGPYDSVEVTDVPGVIFERGKEYEVPVEVADGMLIQAENWHVPGNAAAKKKAHEKAVKDHAKRHADLLAGEAQAAAESEQPEPNSTESSDSEGATA